MVGRAHISPTLRLYQSYEHVIVYTFNGDAIFLGAIPTYGVLPVLHDMGTSHHDITD